MLGTFTAPGRPGFSRGTLRAWLLDVDLHLLTLRPVSVGGTLLGETGHLRIGFVEGLKVGKTQTN